MGLRRILALSPIPEEGAGCRFRIAQYAPFLASAGYELKIHPLFDERFFRMVYQPGRIGEKAGRLAWRTLARARAVWSSGKYDAVFIYREAYPIGPPLFERMIARRRIPIIYDFDDAIYLPNTSEANRLIGFLKRPGKTAEILRLSSHVIAGNQCLADYATDYATAITVIPTCVDTAVWKPSAGQRSHDAAPVIGWIGTPTTTSYLLQLSDALRRLAQSHRFILRVSGSAHPVEIAGVTVDNSPWQLSREVELFSTCDVGVYPLPDDPWARGKSGLKAIQFMACGVPLVAAPVGVNREIVRDGTSGFFATTPAEWVGRLRLLLESAELRARIGDAGRETVAQRYSLAVAAPRMLAAIETTLERPRSS